MKLRRQRSAIRNYSGALEETSIEKLAAQAVLLDIDGTLLSSVDAYYWTFTTVLDKLNASSRSLEWLKDRMNKGKPLRDILSEALQESPGGKEEKISIAIAEMNKLFRDAYFDKVRLVPGATETLRILAQEGIRLGITTARVGSPEDEMERLRNFGIGDYISTIVTAAEVPRRKPSPDVIIEAARRLRLRTSECVVVDDSAAGIKAGKLAGSLTIAVLSGVATHSNIQLEKPDLIINDITVLPSVVQPSSRGEKRGNSI